MKQDNSSFENLMGQVNKVVDDSKMTKCFTCNTLTYSENYRCIKCNRFKLHDTIFVIEK